jgi:hypothetical protein
MARAARNTEKSVESLKHREARRKHIPTTELESLVSEDEQAPRTIRITARSPANRTRRCHCEERVALRSNPDPTGARQPQIASRSLAMTPWS